jgi:hypothetical protein
MKRVCSQPYIKIERLIQDFKQKIVEKEEFLHLCDHYITTPTHQFLLKEVHDLSFRTIHKDSGLLYLHTNQGLFAYHVKMTPHRFMDAFQELKQRYFET